MDNIGGMHVKAASQKLIHEVLSMVIRQVLPRVNHSMHIGLHKICDDIDILKTRLCWRLLHINQSNDVFMIKEFYKVKY